MISVDKQLQVTQFWRKIKGGIGCQWPVNQWSVIQWLVSGND